MTPAPFWLVCWRYTEFKLLHRAQTMNFSCYPWTRKLQDQFLFPSVFPLYAAKHITFLWFCDKNTEQRVPHPPQQHPLLITGFPNAYEISMWAWEDGKPSTTKAARLREGVGRARPCKMSPSPLCGSAQGWAAPRGEAVFITGAAKTTRGYFQNGSLCGCWADTRVEWKTWVYTGSHLEKASSRPSSSSCHREDTHTRWLLRDESSSCDEILMHSHINAVTFGHFSFDLHWSSEVNVVYSQPHTLPSYVTIW